MDNFAIYKAWKEKLARNGKTPMNIVAFCRSIGMGDYADELQSFIQKMEESTEALAATR